MSDRITEITDEEAKQLETPKKERLFIDYY